MDDKDHKTQDQKTQAALDRIQEGLQTGKVNCLIMFARFDTEPGAIDEYTIVKGVGQAELPLLDQIKEDVIRMADK